MGLLTRTLKEVRSCRLVNLAITLANPSQLYREERKELQDETRLYVYIYRNHPHIQSISPPHLLVLSPVATSETPLSRSSRIVEGHPKIPRTS